ncbi:MAG: S46 family peptidase, partial [Bacteroidales bacterium]|nr:S46 family peptidase [Bacteroidales bacterium]
MSSCLRRVLLTVLLSLCALCAFADEGMFMINAIDAALEKKMQERGLALSAKAIYDADAPGATLSDAIVSLEFMGTGSIISHDGLLITNHHCAYSDLHALSTPQKNYLEEGLRAETLADEIPIKGKTVQFLKQVLDVTEEVMAFMQAHPTRNRATGFRKLSWNLEKKYQEQTGLTAQLASMWGGSKYYICLYREYKDVRLVAAPPVCLAAFGGDVDNWQWPQQKCDFALYRIYAAPDGQPAEYSPDNRPAHFDHPLKISVKGLKEKDYTMVIGYPGSTDRYSSSFKVRLQQEIILPLANAIRGEKMRLMKEAMNADPQVRLHYADKFFSLSNYQELQQMQEACCKRFDVVSEKRQKEKVLQEWIDADSLRRVKWGGLLPEMDSLYRAAETTKYRVTLFQETMVRATAISIFATRLSTAKGRCEPKEWEDLDMDLERKIFELAVRTWYERLDTACMSAFHKA